MNQTPIQKAIEKFETLKQKSENLRDVIYLDGVLTVLEQLLPYEEEVINQEKNNAINEVLSLYVADGNPQVWRDKIIKLKSKQNE